MSSGGVLVVDVTNVNISNLTLLGFDVSDVIYIKYKGINLDELYNNDFYFYTNYSEYRLVLVDDNGKVVEDGDTVRVSVGKELMLISSEHKLLFNKGYHLYIVKLYNSGSFGTTIFCKVQ